MTSEEPFIPSKYFTSFLKECEIGIVVTTANNIISVSHSSREVLLNVWISPTINAGEVHHSHDKLYVSCSYGICEYTHHDALSVEPKTSERYFPAYVPRTTHIIGDVGVRDVVCDPESNVIFVSSLLNGVCVLTPTLPERMKVIYRPPCISNTTPGDRCHVTGVCLKRDGSVSHVTLASPVDYHEGWKDSMIGGGEVIDGEGRVVCKGLTLPHSPRLDANGVLYLLDSGNGRLLKINDDGTPTPIVFIPGFLRGMRIIGRYAIVGVSKIIDLTLPVYQEVKRMNAVQKPGVRVVNLDTGVIEHSLEIRSEGCDDITGLDVVNVNASLKVEGMTSDVLRKCYTYT